EFDLIGFSLTHELCYTNVLYMLNLAGIPLYSAQRLDTDAPLIAAGGGCTLAAEPMAPFFDLMFLGDGEEVLPEFMRLLERSKVDGLSKARILELAAAIPGIYVPAFFEESGSRLPPHPRKAGYEKITRRALKSLDDAFYPVNQPVPFGAVHNRLTLEIARGCTRGCRFCQAGMVYRPVRERSLPKLGELLETCLSGTGFDEVSYLSLSTGDFSALKTFFMSSIDRCAREQIAVSLPSLRVGSIDDAIMERMAGIRRTGATLAPEAGSQRLRDVINKGVTEEELILHTQKLFEHGWQQVKFYFMIGLPGETDEDLLAIIDLCKKARDCAGPGIKRLQITASVSPFVPKPHTPFQWEAQIPLAEMKRRIKLLLNAVKPEKRIKLRWHEADMSFLEGIFSRGDRRLAKVVEDAYRKGDLFTAWVDQFKLEPWLEAMRENNLRPEEFTGALNLNAPLPWEHLSCGLSKQFLLAERERGLTGQVTPDCRYASCQNCGVCVGGYSNRLNLPQRDQAAHQARLDEHGRVITRAWVEGKNSEQNPKNLPPALAASLVNKVNHYRIWYRKEGPATCISQLELQAVLERAMRRGKLPLAFSQGFKPAPLLSFARALPVGVASRREWFSLYLREARTPAEVLASFRGLPRGLNVTEAVKLPLHQRPAEAVSETYRIEWVGGEERHALFLQAVESFTAKTGLAWVKQGKKHTRELDARALVPVIRKQNSSPPGHATFEFVFDWSCSYASPLALTLAALGLSLAGNETFFSAHELLLTKLSQSDGA
ncbi:MAG: TIGR03960 family B12-binding radical SAM protein, partial [Deltaproteobacteria bacterium]|nr:TIGR03960 family B12-binding radical SAM protein [Deltaproteobacteria bacterium]